MVSTRSKLKLDKTHNKNLDPPMMTNIFKTLISALEAPEGINLQLLKSSYYLLIQLSSKQQLCLGKGADLNELFMKTNEGEVRLTLRDVYTLSNILFKDLQRRMKQLQSSNHVVSASQSLELEELNLLIRCCMVTLTFHVPQDYLMESGRVLLLMFKKLSLLEVSGGCHGNADLKKSLSCQCMYSGEKSSDSFAKVASLSSLELFDPCIPSVTSMLEVLIDELLLHSRLRKYLQIIDSCSSTSERLFEQGANCGDFGVLMEMICCHFSLSICHEGALLEFLNKVPWVCYNNSKSLELSVISARTLLRNPVVLSSPKLLQAHVVSLVSDVISERTTSDHRLIDCYISVFEISVILYTQHMSILKTELPSADARDTNNGSSQPSYESCIEPVRRQKLNHMITMLNDSWNSNLRKKFFTRKSELVASSIEYIQRSLHVIESTCRNDVLSFLRCMLTRAAKDVNNIKLPLNGDASLQDICLLASLLMLMSNSLIKAVGCLKAAKEYEFIVGIIKCFKVFSIRLPIQKLSYNLMETHSTSHEELRLMLLHFLGLLSLSFDSGLEFLVKSCISVIMALTNLFILKEGNIDGMMALADPIPSPSEGSLVVYKEEARVSQYPTCGVAAKFHEIRTLYVSSANDSMECVEESCGGEVYLKTRLKGWGDVDDFDELAEFVECKKGKDYVDWLKNREKFRERKLRKGVKRRWEKKKQVWRSMRGK